MAPKDTPTAPAPFDWDDLLPAVDAPAPKSTLGSKIDVRTEVPASIRRRAEESLGHTMSAIAKTRVALTTAGKIDEAAKAEQRTPPQWKLQPTPTLAVAEEYARLLKRYSQYRPGEADWGEGLEFYVPGSPIGQVTARAAAVVITADPLGHPTTRGVTDDDKETLGGVVTGKDGLQFGVRYAVKPLENRKAANGK